MNKQIPLWAGILFAALVGAIVFHFTPKPKPDTVKPIQDKIDTIEKKRAGVLIEAEQHSYQQVKKADRITKQAKAPIVIPEPTTEEAYEKLSNYKHQEYE